MRDPAFLFYPGDWILGTMGMSFEEKGAYIHLLMMQFNVGHMTELMIGREIGLHWDTIKVKFIQDENGLWYNVRLQDEKEKRKAFTESRRNNKSGKNQHSKKEGHTTSHMEPHMGNENKDVNSIVNSEEKSENIFLKPEATEPYQKPETGSEVVKECLNRLNDEINICYTSPTQIDESKLPEWFLRFTRVHPTIQRVKIHQAFKDFGNSILASGEHNELPKTQIEKEIKRHFINKFNKANGK